MAERIIFVRRPRHDEDEEHGHTFGPHGEDIMNMIFSELQEIHSSEAPDRDEEIRRLWKHMTRLESRPKPKLLKTHGEVVYETLLPTLRKKHTGKVVAIETDREELAGIGDTIEEAYLQAKDRFPDKEKFYFRRVGKSYLFRV